MSYRGNNAVGNCRADIIVYEHPDGIPITLIVNGKPAAPSTPLNRGHRGRQKLLIHVENDIEAILTILLLMNLTRRLKKSKI
jgi:hypothetical protein